MAPMGSAVKSDATQPLDRINLRLPAELFQAIDANRARRPGTVSRNTWITEAIQEKLLRERVSNDKQPRAGESNGRLL
jgi:metal-responsive CopG/Arc/MetJ family transcriptional regulator